MMKNLSFLLLSIVVLPAMGQQYHTRYKVRRASWQRLEVTHTLDDSPLQQAIDLSVPYKAKVDSIMMPELGLSRCSMSAGRPESLLGNWVADVFVEGGTATGLEPADMGLVNVGGLRNNMPEGIVRVGDIMLISPFQNKLVVLEMKGSDMLELMRNIAAVGGEGVSSSVRMTISKDNELLSCTINGSEIDPKATYTVSTIDYLAEGNDKMTALLKALKRHDIDILARDIMSEYVIKHRIIDSKIEGRISVE